MHFVRPILRSIRPTVGLIDLKKPYTYQNPARAEALDKIEDHSDLVDEAFLAEVAGFLGDCDASNAPSEVKNDNAATPSNDDLVLASHQLVEETEELLSGFSAPPEQEPPCKSQSAEPKTLKIKKAPVSAEKRREIWNAQAAKRRQRYRQKVKDEKETLTQQELELTRQLTQLLADQAEAQLKQVRTPTLGVWRAIAIRQLERRVDAEQRQKLLRAEVVGRARMIEQMDMLLQQRLPSDRQVVVCESMNTSEELNGEALFKTFLRDMDGLYAQTNDIMRGLVFKSTRFELEPKRRGDAVFFDIADRIEFPYAFEEAGEVATEVLLSDPNTSLEAGRAKQSKDTHTTRYRIKYRLRQGRSVDFVISGAGKKYKEKDRLVYLWRGITEGQGEFDGIQSDETSWIVVRPSSGATLLECYSRFVPVTMGMKTAGDDIDRFVRVLAETGAKEMIKMLENLILNDP
ncbi:hypothetical protein ON010_g11626 [Phytophthora cinnamomi]|nr:hypothetical protein ON010_g11626 [Phytophthora cinnamomi]